MFTKRRPKEGDDTKDKLGFSFQGKSIVEKATMHEFRLINHRDKLMNWPGPNYDSVKLKESCWDLVGVNIGWDFSPWTPSKSSGHVLVVMMSLTSNRGESAAEELCGVRQDCGCADSER